VPPNGLVYTNHKEDEAIITVRNESVFGSIKTHDGGSFAIEQCHNNHILKVFNVKLFPDEECFPIESKSMIEDSKTKSVADNKTIVTYSVMIYYTLQFASVTADVEGFVNQVIAETNQGYINSGIPVRIIRFCHELAIINDTSNTLEFLNMFNTMKGKVERLLNSADSAHLLANRFQSCGAAYVNSIGVKRTVSLSRKDCALGYYTFGHELAHNFGCNHDPRTTTNNIYPYGHGHLIEGGYRTILAYSAPGFRSRINFYSNPNIRNPFSDTPTGLTGISDNAAVLFQNRFKMASVGDESAKCKYDIFTQQDCKPRSYPILAKVKVIKKNMQKWSNCKDKCNFSVNCHYFIWKTGRCTLLKIVWRKNRNYFSGSKHCL